MAYVRNRDIKKAGVSNIVKERGVALSKIKKGKHNVVKRKVPTYTMRGKLFTKPTYKKKK